MPIHVEHGYIRGNIRTMTLLDTSHGSYVPLTGFGAAMKQARRARGWTQVQLAELAEVNPETIIRIEQGMNTRQNTMEKIRNVLPDIAPVNGQGAERRVFIGFNEQEKAEADAVREQVIHLIRAVTKLSLLNNLLHVTLQQLNRQAAKPEKHTATKARKPKK